MRFFQKIPCDTVAWARTCSSSLGRTRTSPRGCWSSAAWARWCSARARPRRKTSLARSGTAASAPGGRKEWGSEYFGRFGERGYVDVERLSLGVAALGGSVSVYLSGHDTALLGGDIAADRPRAWGTLLPAEGWGFSLDGRGFSLDSVAVSLFV